MSQPDQKTFRTAAAHEAVRMGAGARGFSRFEQVAESAGCWQRRASRMNATPSSTSIRERSRGGLLPRRETLRSLSALKMPRRGRRDQ